MSDDFHSGLSDPKVNITLDAMQKTGAEEQQELSSEQLSSKLAFQSTCEEAINPFIRVQKQQKSIESNKSRLHKMLNMGEKSKQLGPVEMIKDNANQFQRRNPELKAPALISLRELIKPGDTKEEIIKKLMEFYPDVSLADEVFEFLLVTTEGDLAQTIKEAKEEFHARFEREITAGKNIGTHAREAAEKGLGSPSNLRDMYRNITGNPRDSTTLFQELSQRYAYKELKKVVDFLLHSLGADMKSKGPSIPRGQLHRLFTETRSLQAILGVYRFFRGRMGLMQSLFTKEGLEMPPQLNFETMAKEFMALAGERYPSPDKVLHTAVKLGVEKWIMAKIIALSQLRDAIREVAVNQIYRSLQHRDELYLAILEALADLEDELEELLEREEGEAGEEEEEEEEQDEDDEDETSDTIESAN